MRLRYILDSSLPATQVYSPASMSCVFLILMLLSGNKVRRESSYLIGVPFNFHRIKDFLNLFKVAGLKLKVQRVHRIGIWNIYFTTGHLMMTVTREYTYALIPATRRILDSFDV